MENKQLWKEALDRDIHDSGNRTMFETGAVRDIQEDKGRCDLLPLRVIGEWAGSQVINEISKYVEGGDIENIWDAIEYAIGLTREQKIEAILDVSIQFKEGAVKYGERNWEKGIPAHSYIDSGVRHYLKHLRGDEDENHKRAFIWNMLCLIYTHAYLPEMIDLPFKKNS